MHNQAVDLYERAVTFEGKAAYSVEVPLQGRAVTNEIRKVAKQIQEVYSSLY